MFDPAAANHPDPLVAALRPALMSTLAWLRGEIDTTPHHTAPPVDLDELMPVLTRSNERGVCTVAAQPGLSDPDDCFAQRAVLTAVTTPARAQHLAAALGARGLVADCWPLASVPAGRGVVSVSTCPCCHTLALVPADVVVEMSNGCLQMVVADPDAAQAWADSLLVGRIEEFNVMAQYYLLEVVEPTWGPEDRLWTALYEALLEWDVVI